jgi:hypothetical protein
MVSLIYGSMNLQLKNPELGNTDSLEYTRLSRETLGGDVIIYRDPQWPKIEKLNITFDLCDEKLISQLKILIKLSLGKQITYIDYNGITWTVLITNPNTAIKQSGINTYIAQLELEAQLA